MTDVQRHNRFDVMRAASLIDLDNAWRETVACSLPGKVWASVTGFVEKLFGGKTDRFGSLLQLAGFLVVVALSAALGARQFANDKEALALIVAAGVGLWVVGRILGGKERYKACAIDALVLAWGGINVVAACSSHYPAAGMIGLAKLIVFIAGYFLFAAATGQSRRRLIITVAVLVATGFLVSLYGLYQYKIGVQPLATWEDPSIEVKGVRIFSTLGNPNLLAGYLVPLVPLGFSLVMLAAWKKRFWLSLPLLGVVGVIAVAVILTGSRGGYIGLAGSMAAFTMIAGSWLWREKPGSRAVIVLSALALLIVFALLVHFVPTVEQRVLSVFAGGEHTSNRYRMNVWISSFHMFKDSWWFGVGPGNKAFELSYGLYMKSGFDALGTYCVPLELAVEAGVAALAAFGALLAASLCRAHVNFYAADEGGLRWIIAGCASAIVGIMAHGLVDTVFFRPQVQLIFWIMVAVVVTAGKLSGKKADVQVACPS